MKLVRHVHVVSLKEVLASRTKIFIVLELVTGGELFDKIVAEGKFNETTARKYFQQLVAGTSYCHSQGVCHRDLKPENLLLDEHEDLKISGARPPPRSTSRAAQTLVSARSTSRPRERRTAPRCCTQRAERQTTSRQRCVAAAVPTN